MKIYIVGFILFSSLLTQAQQAPFIDFNNYFRTFYKQNFRQLEFQPIRSFEGSDHLTVYSDYRGDFRLYDGENVQILSNQIISYKLSDAQLAWNIGPTLFCMSNGKKEMLSTFANNYFVSDSLIVFENTRFNSMSVKQNDQIIQLYQMTGDLEMPVKIGDNTIVFKDNGDFYKIYWRGKIFDYAVYTKPVVFDCGMDVVCFNDPINQSFAVFDKGELMDLETQFVKRYQAARGFVVYEDIQGNLWHYANGEKQQLSNFGVNFWEAKDDLVIWNENGQFYIFSNGEKKQLLNYVPKNYKIKNATLVFQNIMGGISAFSNGKLEELTKQLDCKYEIYGNTVLVQLFNRNYLVYSEGKTYEP